MDTQTVGGNVKFKSKFLSLFLGEGAFRRVSKHLKLGLPILCAGFLFTWTKINFFDPRLRVNGVMVFGQQAKDESTIFLVLAIIFLLLWLGIIILQKERNED